MGPAVDSCNQPTASIAAMEDSELAFASALEQARLVRTGELSPVDLVELYLRRIETFNPLVNAYITVAAERAILEAREAESRTGNDLPLFHGVPISIKDVNDTAGIRSTWGVGGFRDRIPEADDNVVARLRRAGFIVIGKTNVPELGTTCTTEPLSYGPCRNPWDLERSVGGSSGGAAASVAAGLVPIAQGGDGGGSLRTPAAACGLYTIKPSRGRVSSAPAPSNMISIAGPISRTVADAASMLDALSGYVAGDAFWAQAPERPYGEEVGRDPGKLHIAFTHADAEGAPVMPAAREAVRRAAHRLADLGHNVEEAAPDGWADYKLVELVMAAVAGGVAAMEPQLPPVETLDPVTQGYLARGRSISAGEYIRSTSEVYLFARQLVSWCTSYDVLLTPQNAITPPRLGWLLEHPEPEEVLRRSWMFAPFTAQWNFSGQPAASVPFGFDDQKMPVSVQLVGRPNDEATLFRLSAQLEAAEPWALRRPGMAIH
jgi:amidase